VLASASPQRRAILEQLRVDFTVSPAGVDERADGDPQEVARANAVLKAEAVRGELVLGVDTVVALDGEIFGKPEDAAAARATLGRLAGRTHQVHSGIALRRDGALHVAVATTEVGFAAATGAELDAYVATGEWRGRAGGYAIQGRGALLVEGIRGDYFNVVGLPVAALRALWPQLAQDPVRAPVGH
jgi:septum formation protein